MSKSVFLALFALICSVAAHAGHGGNVPYGWRNTRAETASTCAVYQCAVSGGNCNANMFCPAGQHCQAGQCTNTVLKIGDTCDVTIENVCAQGSCVDGTCQIFREIMPGNKCEFDSQCFYSETAEGNGLAGKCVDSKCSGKAVGEVCVASHQCNVGSFCSAGTCQAVGLAAATCSADNECDSMLSCVAGKCATRFSQAEGQSCSSTTHCAAGLYCNGNTCARAVSTSSNAQCSMSASNCAAGEKCSCNGGATATCKAQAGTEDNMVAIEKAAFDCLNANGCNADTGNTTSLACISSKCSKQFCTYFTRSMTQLYDMPTCVRARAVGNPALAQLVESCSAYAPGTKPSSSSAGALTASMVLVALAAIILF